MRLIFLVLAALPAIAAEQPRLGAALKLGVPLQGWFQDVQGRESATDKSGRWFVGAALELHLIAGFSVEAGANYRQVGIDYGGGYSFAPFSNRERGFVWEFPVVGKYYLPVGPKALRPFVVAGPSVRWLRTHTDSKFTVTETDPNTGGPRFVPGFARSSTAEKNGGLSAGLGIEPGAGRARLIIEARYTRWLGTEGCFGATNQLRCAQPNQGLVLFGIGF